MTDNDTMERISLLNKHLPDRPTRPRVTELRQTSSFAPCQWEGETLRSGPIYIKYRANRFEIRVGAMPLDEKEPEVSITHQWEADHFSRISENEMKHVLTMYLNFNC